jgi:uncharacterized protein (TIGR01244 family)
MPWARAVEALGGCTMVVTLGRVLSLGLALAAALFAVATVANAQLMNRAEPLESITTSGQPSPPALAALAREGFATVIDLRAPDEPRGLDEPATVAELGMSYVSLPVAGPDDVTYDNAAALDEILRAAQGRVLIHCATGNRAGALLSLRQRLLGAAPEEALAVGVEAGLTSPALREVVEERLRTLK